MKGFIARTVTALCLTGGLVTAGGCVTYHDLVDPCWPQRYEYMARKEVIGAFAPQVYNGHILDQTVWNYHFEAGTDHLTPGGMEHLAYIARRRPCPDPTVYVQIAQDVPYDPAAPEKFVDARAALDSQRAAAVQKYLTAYTAGRNVAFNVVLHDPAEVGMAAIPMGVAVQKESLSPEGVLVIHGGIRTGGGGR